MARPKLEIAAEEASVRVEIQRLVHEQERIRHEADYSCGKLEVDKERLNVRLAELEHERAILELEKTFDQSGD